MTTTINNEHKELNFSSEREQSQTCLNSAEHEKNQGRKVLNVPNLRFPEFQGEWEKKSLGEIGDSFIGLTYRPTDVVSEGGLIVFRSSNIQNGCMDYKDIVRVNKNVKEKLITKKDDLLVCARNGSARLIGKNAILHETDTNQTFGAFMMVFRSDKNHFVHQLLNTRRYSSQVSENLGARINQITSSDLSSFEFFFPKENSEMNKISALLDLLDERIATQNKIIEGLKKLKSAIINYAINSLDTDFAKFSSLYEMAGEGGTPTTSNASFYDNGKIPFIKIDDLKQKYLTENKDFITELGLQKSSAWLVPTHSILFSNGATIGEISITTYPVCTKQGILGIVPKQNIDVEFLYYFMSSSYFKKAVSRIVTEGTMKTAYLKDINNILCPIPTKEKQQEIAKMPSALNSKIDFEQSILKLFCSQKQHLLRQMFI